MKSSDVGRGLLLWAVLAAPDASASTLFSDGFEPCCTVGGRVSGLQGPGLVLRLEAGSDTDALAIAGNGRYAFRLQLAEGQAYRVSVQAQPAAGPHCRVFNANGVLALASATDADVACSDGLSWDAGVWGEDWR